MSTMDRENEKQVLSPSDAPDITRCLPTHSSNTDGDQSQILHRVNLVNTWGIKPGDCVLEIGCGQGLCTTVLATAVGSDGHVDAVDPAPLDYGSPFTLGQAQDFISKSKVGSRISWLQKDPLDVIRGSGKTWDVAVLAHSIWYFDTPHRLTSMLEALRSKAKKVCIAEYALQASEETAVPHVHAAIGRGFLESQRETLENIRTPLSPGAILERVEKTGWTLEKEEILVPSHGLQDGAWEVSMFCYEKVKEEVEILQANDQVKQMILSARDVVLASLRSLDGARVSTMDVWVAVLEHRA